MSLRVLHIGPKNYPPAHGGVEKSIYDLANGMTRVKSFVAVEWDQAASEDVLVLPVGSIARARAIREFARAKDIDVLHFNKEGFIPLALWFHFAHRWPVVLTIRGCAWRLRKWNPFIRFALYVLDLWACLLLRQVVFVGRRDYEHFSRLFPWRSFSFIPNGVVDHPCSASGGAGEFVFVGRISAEKNVLRMIQWFDRAKTRLTVYGPIDERSRDYGREVLAAIDESAYVSYGGVLAHTDLFASLSKYGAFINPSFSEGMPVSVLEAASVGLMLVLSDIRQHRDLGFPDAVYVRPDADEIVGLDKIGGYSAANVEVVKNRYSINSTCVRYEEIYSKIAGNIV